MVYTLTIYYEDRIEWNFSVIFITMGSQVEENFSAIFMFMGPVL